MDKKEKHFLEFENGKMIDQDKIIKENEESQYNKWEKIVKNNKDKIQYNGDFIIYNIPKRFWEKLVNECDWLDNNDFFEEYEDKSLEDLRVEDFLIIKYNKITGEEISKKVNIDKVSEYIEDKLDIRTIFGIREETLEFYKDGIWTTTGRGVIKSEIEKLLSTYSRNNIVAEVLEKIKRRTEISREDADDIPNYKRCLENGVLDLENIGDIKILEHSKDYNFKNKLPIKYNETATCPNVMKFINQTFYKENIPQVQEWFGFHLVRRYFLKKSLIVHGAKNTGKTVFLNLLTMFLGNNVSGLSLQEISRGKPFDLMVLKDKDANICDDLSSSDMKAIGGFKMAVGDGFITGEQKFGEKIRFRNTAKNTDACNTIPTPGEDIDDEAYYERILLLPIDNIIERENMDRELIDKLTTEEELSGLLNWAISGYKRLIEQNGFSNEKTPEETKFLMVQNGNSLARFSTEVLIHKNGSKISKEDMYKVYCEWCRKHKPQLSPDSKEKIGRNLNKFASYTQASSTGKERYWLNIKITDTYYTFLKNIREILIENNSSKNGSKNNIYNFSNSVISVSKNDDKN